MDVLSTLLKTVKLEGAMFYNAEFSAPWSFRSPPSCLVAPYHVAGARHVIIYHLLAWAGLRECRGRSASFAVRRGHRRLSPRRSAPHGNGRNVKPRDHAKILQEILSQGLKLARMGGGGEITRFVCGYLVCEPQLSKAFLGGLPPIFKVSIGSDSSGKWLENCIRYSVDSYYADKYSHEKDARQRDSALAHLLRETIIEHPTRPRRSSPIIRQSLAAAVVERLRDQILNGELCEGEQLRQDAIATEFQISRIPVREALSHLAAEGLVTIVANRGAVVSALAPEEIEQLFETRAVLECYMLRCAVPNFTDADFLKAERILRQYEDSLAKDSDIKNWGEWNWSFHSALYGPANRPSML